MYSQCTKLQSLEIKFKNYNSLYLHMENTEQMNILFQGDKVTFLLNRNSVLFVYLGNLLSSEAIS